MNPVWILLTGMLVVVGGVLFFRLHAFLAFLLGALVVSVLISSAVLEQVALERGMDATAAGQWSARTVGERVATGFGKTCGQIGIIIAMAAIIGTCLLKSGAADRIVRSVLGLFGERRAPLVFLGSVFLLGIPVFFDTVFYLMMPLGKAMMMRTGRNYLFYVLAIGCGSKAIWWMNDSGFWVVSQMSGMTEREGLRMLTPMSLLMGVVGLAVTAAGAWLFPLV